MGAQSTVEGTCEERFSSVKEIFQAHLDSGREIGAAVAVCLGNRLVVDLWGGYTDRQ